MGDVSQAAQIAAFLIGGTLAAGSHAVKAGSRVLINTTPEPFTNWAASLSEDLLVIGGLWTALHHPSVFLGGLVLFLLVSAWLLPRIFWGIKRVFRSIATFFGRRAPRDAGSPPGG